ncbi:hemolysin family protein [Blastococcus sp. Marseille-P5729]|uniref:hemolysin family protein n=1 Tax=Blastococcus sp. Marseille-P5729 TaxID=2086582 RepID=UPI000D112A63|nr:hemolysin family protein [Blastococcus sp. Marseille-P5729]
MLVDILIVLGITILASFFVAAEIALVSLRDSQVQRLAEFGGKRGKRLKRLLEDPNRFLAVVQVGVTVLGFLSAAFGAERLGKYLTPVLMGWGLSNAAASLISLLLVTLAVAYVSLVIGELTPKRLALQRSEGIAMALAPTLDRLARVFRPVIWLLGKSTNVVVRLLGGDPQASREEMSGDELRAIVGSSESLSRDERQLIGDVLDAGERDIREIMLPRGQVAFLDGGLTVSKATREARDSPHSRYPVTGADGQDDIVGFVHIRDLLLADPSDRSQTVRNIARPVLHLPGSKKVLESLGQMRRGGQHLAIVVDEYGGTDGIVTLEDLIEEIIGDIRDEYDDEDHSTTSRLASGDYEIEGGTNLGEFTALTGVELPEGPYESVGGFVMARLGRVPRLADSVTFDTDRHTGVLTVSEVDGRRAARLHVAAVAKARPEDEDDEP